MRPDKFSINGAWKANQLVGKTKVLILDGDVEVEIFNFGESGDKKEGVEADFDDDTDEKDHDEGI